MMHSLETWSRTERLFHELIAMHEPDRTTLLEARCGSDTALMLELRSLLRACEAEEKLRGSLEGAPGESGRHTLLGPYQLDRLLGRGGMGAVYLAHRSDGQYEQQVAIKVIDVPLGGPLFEDRFRQERQVLALLVHPFIARLLGGGVSDQGELYLVLEYVEGVTITRFCAEKRLSVRARLQLFLEVCDAVQYAHQNLVVHRDLKPDNILIAADGTPRLLDFGTAKLLAATPGEASPNATQSGLLAYTPQYASPEQVLGETITIASDVYSLGVLLYLLVAEVPPYLLPGLTTGEMIRVICHEIPRKPTSVTRAERKPDADLDAIILKSLRKEPGERYLTVDQFASDIGNLLSGQPVRARAGTLRYRTTKFLRRNRLPLFAACMLLFTVLAGIGGVLWQSRIANQQRRRSEARSADLRELSNSLLSELDEALKDIPGSTGAQQLLITRVLQHLDRMANDADGDRQTGLDLINAYTLLGNVQGNVYVQNLADHAGAVPSFDKALALAAVLVVEYPHDRDVLRAQAAAFEARGEVLSDTGVPQTSVESLEHAVAIYDRAVQLPSASPAEIFEAAVSYEVLGNELSEDSGMADHAAGEIAYRHALDMDAQALRADPAFLPARRGLPVMHLHLGVLVQQSFPARALQEFEQALRLAEALPEDQKAKLAQVRLRATLHRKVADADAELGRYVAAAPQFAQAHATIQHLVELDSKNSNALADLERLEEDEATAAEAQADPRLGQPEPTRLAALHAAAIDLEHESATLRQAIHQTTSHTRQEQTLALVLIRESAVRNALHRVPENQAEALASLNTLRRAADSPQAAAGDMDAMVRAELAVVPARLRNPALAVHYAQQGVALTHHRQAEYLLLLAEAYRVLGEPERSRQAAREGLSLLQDSSLEITKSRQRRLLEWEAY